MGENYVPPPKKLKPFEGVGQKLGSFVPGVDVTSYPPQSKEKEPEANSKVEIDKSQPVTTLQIRLSNGSRFVSVIIHRLK